MDNLNKRRDKANWIILNKTPGCIIDMPEQQLVLQLAAILMIRDVEQKQTISLTLILSFDTEQQWKCLS